MATVLGNPDRLGMVLSGTFEEFLSQEYHDNFFNEFVMLEQVAMNGRIKERVGGGTEYLEPLLYGRNPTAGSFRGYDEFDNTPADPFTDATYQMARNVVVVQISGEEIDRNSGKAKVIDVVESQVDLSMTSMYEEINRQLFADGTGNSGKDIDGIRSMITTGGIYAGIPRGTNPWWNPQEEAVGGPLALDGADGILRMWNDCGRGGGKMKPDMIITTQYAFEDYLLQMPPKFQYTPESKANIMFTNEGAWFKGARISWDHMAPSGRMFFINNGVIRYVVQKDLNFSGFVRKTGERDAQVADWIMVSQLTCNNARHLGVLTGITENV